MSRALASPRARRSQAGFTLVELLLAFSLMALLLALAYGGLRAATRATTSGQAQLEDTGQVRVTHQFIRRQLNQLRPLPFDTQDGEPQGEYVVFAGDSQRIQFVAPMPGYLGQGGPQVQSLEFVDGPKGRDLVFNHELLLEYDPEMGMQNPPIILMEELAGGHFEFLARDQQGKLIGWTDSWPTPEELPVAVRLDISFEEGRMGNWPLMTTGVKVDELATTSTGAPESYTEAIRAMIQRPGDTRR